MLTQLTLRRGVVAKTARQLAVFRFVMVCLLGVGFSSALIAQEASVSGTSSRQAKQDAVSNLPYHQLNEATRNKLNQVLQKPSFYRRLPVSKIDVEPDHFQFLVRYPEVVVNIWQLMGITQMSATRTGPFSLDTNDGAGTISSLELVYGSPDLHIFYGSGSYEGSVIKRKLTGRCVLILRTSYDKSRQGRSRATNRLDVFLKLDNTTVSLVAKTIQPLVGPTADHNFTESLKFVQRLNETTRTNGPGVQQMAKRFQVDGSVRQEYVQVVDDVFKRAMAEQAASGQVPDTTLPASFQSSNFHSGRQLQDRKSTAIPAQSIRLSDQAITQPRNSGPPRTNRNHGYLPPSYSNYGLPVPANVRTARSMNGQALNSPHALHVR